MNRQCVQRTLLSAHGLTLVEVLLALVISGLVATAVLAMLVGVGTATRESNDTRRATVGRQVAIARLGVLIRCTASILACDNHRLVLWEGDTDLNTRPNLSELLLISWASDTKEVRAYKAPSGISSSQDMIYNLKENFADVTEAVAGSSVLPGEVMLQHVTAWEADYEASSGLIRLRLEIDQPSGPDAVTIIAGPLARVD